MNLNTLFIITLLSTLGFIACENPAHNQGLKAKDAQATPSRDALSKVGKQSQQSQFVALNMKLLGQSHGVFLQVWKKVFTNEDGISPISDDKRSIFNESLKSIRTLVTDDGHVRKNKTQKKTRNNCSQEQLAIGVDQLKNKNMRILLYTNDCNDKMVARHAEFIMTSENQLTWTFNPQYFREGVGLRLATLGASKLIQCRIGYEKNGILKSMLCKNLGQDEGEGKHYEFEKFKLDTANKNNEFEGVFRKYKNISEIDKDFRMTAQWGQAGSIQLRVLVPEKASSGQQEVSDSGKWDSNEDNKEQAKAAEAVGATAKDGVAVRDVKNDDKIDNPKQALEHEAQVQQTDHQQKTLEDFEQEDSEPAQQESQQSNGREHEPQQLQQ